jgi:hypothetical protein
MHKILIGILIAMLVLASINDLVLADPTPESCVPLISNGSFETGTSPWEVSPSGTGRTSLTAADGSFSYFLGELNTWDVWVKQLLIIPPSTSLGYFSVAARVAGYESTTFQYDILYVFIKDLMSDSGVRLGELSNTSARYWQVYEVPVVDLSTVAGHVVELTFMAVNDETLKTVFYVDAINLCYYPNPPTATPTRTHTPSHTMTPTPTVSPTSTPTNIETPTSTATHVSTQTATPTLTPTQTPWRVWLPVIVTEVDQWW